MLESNTQEATDIVHRQISAARRITDTWGISADPVSTFDQRDLSDNRDFVINVLEAVLLHLQKEKLTYTPVLLLLIRGL